jgi:hypothetical protein
MGAALLGSKLLSTHLRQFDASKPEVALQRLRELSYTLRDEATVADVVRTTVVNLRTSIEVRMH